MIHVPPGTWELHLVYSELEGQRVIPQIVYVRTLEGLVEGETRDVELDISKLRRGSLHVQLFLHGATLEGAHVSASGNRLKDSGEEEPLYTQNHITSETGQASLRLLPGTYNLHVSMFAEATNRWVPLPTPQPFVMDPGSQLDRVFQIQTRRLRVRVLGSDGETPVNALKLFAMTSTGDSAGYAHTDADGWAVFEHIPIEPIRLSSNPRNMAREDVRMAFLQRTGTHPETLELLVVEIDGMGEETVAELVMPRESGY